MRERRVEEEADERDQPVVLHPLHVVRMRGMDVDDRLQLVGLLPERFEDRIGERRAVDVAEHHRAREPELLHRALELAHRLGRIVERQRRERGEMPPARDSRAQTRR